MSKRKSIELLPVIFRTDANEKFLSGTVDQLIQKPNLKKIDGYVGSKILKTFDPSVDSYLSNVSSNSLRDVYELEPGIVIRNPITDKVEFSKSYEDILNSLSLFGSDIKNQDRLFKQQSYTWNPHIDLDKFVNYRSYVWVPSGPQTVLITGREKNIVSTISVSISEENGDKVWKFSNNEIAVNPTLTLYRGFTYVFEVDTLTSEFYIKNSRTSGSLDQSAGVTNNGATSGKVIFEVLEDTPSSLFYVDGTDSTIFGKFLIRDQVENTELDVEKDILTKKTYQIKEGFSLSNGMTVSFSDNVVPEYYRNKTFIVEGVGQAIELIDYEELVTVEGYSSKVETSFDLESFDELPFDEVTMYPETPDYIVINRASKDKNPWSRYNRWFHIDVINASAEYNNIEPLFDENLRAKRPIIEFEKNLQLYNFASTSKKYVDFLDETIDDAYSKIEGSLGFYIDGQSLEHGNRIVFLNEKDPDVKNNVYEVEFLDIEGIRKIHLKQTDDSFPSDEQGLLVLRGTKNGRTSWVYKNSQWVKAQIKTKVNQTPLFELYDETGVGFSEYFGSDFYGTPIFGYQTGTGVDDPVLGFPIRYGNVSNVGGYQFTNFLSIGEWNYFSNNVKLNLNSKNGFLRINDDTLRYVNSWEKCDSNSIQEIIEQKIAIGGESSVELDSLNVQTSKATIRVFINGEELDKNSFDLSSDVAFDALFLNFNFNLAENDVVVVRALPVYDKKDKGYYEAPINLTNNPLNEYPQNMTYAEINDHLNSILLNASKGINEVITSSNLRDKGDLKKYGRRFVQHEGLVSLAGALITDKDFNLINALRWSAVEYQKFKVKLLQKFTELSSYTSVSEAVDTVLSDIAKDKTVTDIFYYSDMIPYGYDSRAFTYQVQNVNRKAYAYVSSNVYNRNALGKTAISVYLNNILQTIDYDYVLDDTNSLVTFVKSLSLNDNIKIVFFNNVYGACVPFTPTKLGLYPVFEPKIFEDDTYIETQTVLQGHDGSISIAYGDDRDLFMLEIEKRIFNNIKVKYDPRFFDINEVVPGVFRNNKGDVKRFQSILEEEFLRWTGTYGVDYKPNNNQYYTSSFAYNFTNGFGNLASNIVLNGSWRKIFKFYYDTDRPHTSPWEMLGFNEKPQWWDSEYGAAPYTSGNKILWDDLEKGFVRLGNRQGFHEIYTRPGLKNILPVDDYGDLRDPLVIGIIQEYDQNKKYRDWDFGDIGPAENSWRRSSFYPFALQMVAFLSKPAKYATLNFDTYRNKFNIANQLVYSETNLRVSPKDLKIFSTKENGSIVLSTGYSPYIVEYNKTKSQESATTFKKFINNISVNLLYKVGGFSSKEKFKIALETVSSNKTVNQIYIPFENYKLDLNVSSPIKTLSMSGIIIEKTPEGFKVRGYDSLKPYFKIFNAIESPGDTVISVGATSESYITWSDNSNISGGTVVALGTSFYRSKADHKTSTTFDENLYYPLPYLPKIGGIEARVPANFEETEILIPYGTYFKSVQDTFNFILSYGKWLEVQGFVFDELLNELEVTANWMLSGKEFLFWASQNWTNSNIISVAPFAAKVKFISPDAVVQDIQEDFYDYTLLKSDGTLIDRSKINVVRNGGEFKIDTADIPNDGVYFVKLTLVQKENIVVFDNKTFFNDLIYEPISGYKQLRFKITGIITDGWEGDYYVPGFIYDPANIDYWQPDIDYSIGDVVKYQTNFYQAKTKLLPSSSFNYENWVQLGKEPIAQILPNFEYKISQFEDFYSLDSLNFDSAQQKLAQKLIGYTPRTYLNALISDENSQYKFYQGYIREKGTILPLEKLSVSSNLNLGSHIELQEEWAFRVGNFGGENSYKEVEFTLDQNKFKQNPQIFEFDYGAVEPTYDDSYKITIENILVKPDFFDGSPWPTLDTSIQSGNNYQQYQKIPTAGYVRVDDVTFTAFKEDNLLSLTSVSSIKEGDTVWIAMNKIGDWGVKRYTLSTARIINYVGDVENNLIEYITDIAHNLSLRDFIAIRQVGISLDGIFEVIGISSPTSFVVSTTANDVLEPEGLLNGLIYYFDNVRLKSFDDISNIKGLARWQDCERVWVDDDGTGNWAVLQKELVTIPTYLRPYSEQANQSFGQEVLVAPKSKNILVSATTLQKGRVYIYERQVFEPKDIQLKQSFLLEENVSDILTIQTLKNGVAISEHPRNHGKSLTIWESDDLDTRYIVSGAPNSSNAKSINSQLGTQPFERVLNFNFTATSLFDEGAIKIMKFDSVDQYYYVDVVLSSPSPQANAFFGYSVKLAGTTKPFLLVAAPGQNQNLGAIFVFYLDNNNTWKVELKNGLPYNIASEVPELGVNSYFGWEIDLSDDGNTLIVAAPEYLKDRTQAHAGAVFIFRKDPVNLRFNLVQKLYADDFISEGDLLLKGSVVTYDTDEVTLVFNNTLNSLTRNVGNFIRDGFRIGQTISIQGSQQNNGDYIISDLSAESIVFSSSVIIDNENVLNNITITGLGTARSDRFGDSLAISGNGTTIVVSSDHSSENKLDAGMIYVLEKNNAGQYILSQKINSPKEQPGELFGGKVKLSSDGDTLLVSAEGGEQDTPMYFDTYTERYVNSVEIYGSEYVLNPNSSIRNTRTTFDNNSTRFINSPRDTGAVYLFQRLGNKFTFGELLVSKESGTADNYGSGIATDGTFCVVGSPKFDLKELGQTYTDSGNVVIFDKKSDDCGCGSSWSWTKVRYQNTPLVDVEKIKKVFSYNKETLEIVENYEIFDPVKGKLPLDVLREIKYISPFDPAIYTVALNPGIKERVDNKTTWAEDHVGELWFDTSVLRYYWYEQGSVEYRSNNWGKLFPGSTIDVYEWVKSDFRPSDWSELADTAEGLSKGISGQPRFPDNTVLSINQYFDPVINDFVNVYYFWVKNKITLPELDFRRLSSYECARIIEDPKTQGIKYANFLSDSSISLTNTKQDLDSDKINIDIYYSEVDDQISRHSHWQLVNENNINVRLDSSLENKLIDSLVGQDAAGNLVPDPTLSPKLKYGTLNKPRQSWFKNRDAALQTMITFVNNVLRQNDIVGKSDISRLEKAELPPLEKYGKYDTIIDTSDELSEIGTNNKIKADIELSVTNGRIVNATILNPGLGYRIAPEVAVLGDGAGAKIETVIDIAGSVIGVKILNQGYGYTVTPKAIVRPFAVLVNLDLEIDRWAIYYLEDRVYTRKITQTYDVTKYWQYVDWVSEDFNSDIPPRYTVGFVTDLSLNTYNINDTIEITNTGDGRKIILRKTSETEGNYIQGYDLIFREKGTILFSEKLYNKTLAGTGYDSILNFDQTGYDQNLTIEIRIILETIRDNIFINDLTIYWNKFVFSAVRYVLSEQLFVDWVYKTSFVTPVIDAGDLSQKSIYRFNDFRYVEDFIKEIKPFKSKLRDVTVKQNSFEEVNVNVTDFDLPAYVNSSGKISLPSSDALKNVYPFKDWYDNNSYHIDSILVGNPGNSYRIPPSVTILPAVGDSGSGATAVAKINNGKLIQIDVTNKGTGYYKTPSVILVGGGNYEQGFVQGSAYAVIKNSNVRTSSIEFKFDRTSEKGLFTGEVYSQIFTTDGVKLSYVLTYPVDDNDKNYPALQDKNTIKLYLNGSEIGKEAYRIVFRKDLSTIIIFNVALAANQQLRIEYIKNMLYSRDIFDQTTTSLLDTFKLTFPPELDPQKILIKLINTSNNTGSEVPSSDYKIIVKQEKVGFSKYAGYVQFKTIPQLGSRIYVQYAKNINIQNAVDRIISSYEPTSGMPGKDITQLLKGVEFGGVEIQGLNFSTSSGWDGLPWFTQGWDTFANDFKDLLVISNGTTTVYNLGYVPQIGTNINVYFNGVRVDDENFGTAQQKNKNALFATIIANGADETITLPQVPAAGIKIEIRQSISDGVNLPTDDFVLDTNISGGDFTFVNDAGEIKFKTANGLKADDITIDGGQFLSVEHSPAPEELVRGEIFDTVAISVFNSPSTGSNKIETYQFQYDGSTNQFEIEGLIESEDSISVYVNNFVLSKEDYSSSIDAKNTVVTLLTSEYGLVNASINNRLPVTIQKTSIGGEGLLQKISYIVSLDDYQSDSFVIDTAVNYDDIGSFYISNTTVNSSLIKASGRSKRAKILINHQTQKLPQGTLVTIILFDSIFKTYSEIFNQEIVIDGSGSYALTRPPGNIEPLHNMAIVTRLTPSTVNWKGNWEENTSYLVNDSVFYGNKSYECIVPHISIQSITNLNFPMWQDAEQYTINDIVSFENQIYICINNHTSNLNTINPTNVTYWKLHVSNRPDEDVANGYWVEIPKQRLSPPETEYYEITENNQVFSLGKNVPYVSRSLTSFDIEVYRNGSKMVVGQDYEFNFVTNEITISNNRALIGDVIAICVIKSADYLIRNGQIIFNAISNPELNQKIIVTTYTNHDENLMRREVFKGYAIRNEYRLSRPVYSINNLWIDLNGKPLLPNIDYTVIDQNYFKISKTFEITNDDRIVATSISDIVSGPPIAYRIFKDMTNNIQYKRLSKKSSTSLSKGLSPLDREIEVEDPSIFEDVAKNSRRPGVIYIGGERIEYRSKNGNLLGNLTRGTKGTGVAEIYLSGTKIFNFAQSETIPYREGFITQKFKTPEGARYNPELNRYEIYTSNTYNPVTNLAVYELKDFKFNDAVPYENQVTVYLAGKILQKPLTSDNPIIRHDFNITLFSNEVNSAGQTGDIEITPDFIIEKVNNQYLLKIKNDAFERMPNYEIVPNLEIKVIQKLGKIWYTLDGQDSMQQEETSQAKFLREFFAELPDKYYYATGENVGKSYLRDENGVLLRDENGDTLEQD
jgi:hypothetical protein